MEVTREEVEVENEGRGGGMHCSMKRVNRGGREGRCRDLERSGGRDGRIHSHFSFLAHAESCS